METVQIVLDKKLLLEADRAAGRTKRNLSAWCAMLSATTYGGWQTAIWKHAIPLAIPGSGQLAMRPAIGKGRRCSQRNKRWEI